MKKYFAVATSVATFAALTLAIYNAEVAVGWRWLFEGALLFFVAMVTHDF